jgi:hypothetical protein
VIDKVFPFEQAKQALDYSLRAAPKARSSSGSGDAATWLHARTDPAPNTLEAATFHTTECPTLTA